jgi:hypothetical protein
MAVRTFSSKQILENLFLKKKHANGLQGKSPFPLEIAGIDK